MDKIYTQHWIELPKEVREHLRNVLSIPRTGLTEVRDQTLISDGTTNDDLANSVTREALCKYVGSDETFARAWVIAVSKAKYEINPPVVMAVPALEVKSPTGDVILSIPEGSKVDIQTPEAPIVEIKPDVIIVSKELEPLARDILGSETIPVAPKINKWCDHCDSKGIRHSKTCTKPGVVDGFEKLITDDNEPEVPNAF